MLESIPKPGSGHILTGTLQDIGKTLRSTGVLQDVLQVKTTLPYFICTPLLTNTKISEPYLQGRESVSKSNESGEYECEWCGRGFPTKNGLSGHKPCKVSHHPPPTTRLQLPIIHRPSLNTDGSTPPPPTPTR